MIESAKYSEDGLILAVIDGVEVNIPNDPENRHRLMLADWETGGGEIAAYIPPALPVPDRVSANQFGKQLFAMGLLASVQAWVSQQDADTQWSFDRSATFVRTDPMMQAGFAAMGFAPEQMDAFFVAASLL